MKALLIGAGGQVGAELRRRLADDFDVVATSRAGVEGDRALDVSDPAAIEAVIRDVAPVVVVNASAYTAVDRAETDASIAFAVNADAPAAMARACADVGAHFVHYSTDYVFDGSAAVPYAEAHPTCPLGVYGASKLQGEQAVLEAAPDATVVRTAWVYGLHGHNFLRTMLRLGGERDELRVVADQIGSPTPSWLIADVTAELLGSGPPPSGIVHLVASGHTSWHGFAEAIFEEAMHAGRIDRAPRVVPITTEEFPTPTRRPAYSVLDTSLLEARLGRRLPQWRDALRETFRRAAAA